MKLLKVTLPKWTTLRFLALLSCFDYFQRAKLMLSGTLTWYPLWLMVATVFSTPATFTLKNQRLVTFKLETIEVSSTVFLLNPNLRVMAVFCCLNLKRWLVSCRGFKRKRNHLDWGSKSSKRKLRDSRRSRLEFLHSTRHVRPKGWKANDWCKSQGIRSRKQIWIPKFDKRRQRAKSMSQMISWWTSQSTEDRTRSEIGLSDFKFENLMLGVDLTCPLYGPLAPIMK